MTVPASDHIWNIDDMGIDSGLSKLTPETIRDVIQGVLKSEAGARLKVYTEMCVNCGLCAESCHFFLSNDRNPIYTPAAKVKQTIREILRTNGNVDKEFIKRAVIICHSHCNLCRRCGVYCPLGIDVSYQMLLMRRICHKLGVTPRYIQDTAHSHSASYNQMWIKEDEWIDSLIWQEEELREEHEHMRIPMEKEGAEIFYSIIGPEPKFRAQLIYQAAVIMESAGVSWTMPATPGWDNSDMCMFTGDTEMMARLKKVHYETALRLRVKKIVMGECGHAFRSVYDTGNRALSWKMPPVPMIHAVEFYHDLFRSGKLKVKNKFEQPVTFHDPCNISRGMGLHDMGRYVVNQTCETLIEMHPNREHNYCCGAGGGVINCGPPFKETRVEGTRVKAEQLFAAKARGAKVVIAPCHNCHGGLEDIIEHYGLGMELKFLSDIIFEVIEKP